MADDKEGAAAPAIDQTQSFDIVRTFSEKSQELSEAIGHRKAHPEGATDVKESKTDIDITEHLMSPEESSAHHDVDVTKGLSKEDAEKRLERYGKNMLTPPQQEHECIKFVRHLTGFFSLLLWGGSILCFISFGIDSSSQDNLILGIVLAVVVFLTGVFSYMQDAKSAKIMEGFKNFLPEMALVIRDGKKFEMNALDLTRGDIVVIKAGDKIPADVRLLNVTNFRVDNSSLTGESEPQKRNVINKHENPLEATNLAFYGTLSTEGTATGLVIRTGDTTVIGKIAALTANSDDEMTPIAKEIHHFIKIISIVAFVLGISFLIISIVMKNKIIDSLVFTIGIIVANVPEGLLATVTVSLTLTAQRMAQKNVLVKNLESVETLGSTTVIASDKTGTLTQNRMTVAHVYYDDKIRVASSQGAADIGYSVEDPTFKFLQKVGTLCNNAVFTEDSGNTDLPVLQRKTDGDASESAFIKFFHPIYDISKMRKENEKLAEVPFKSANKYQISIHLQDNDKSKDRLLVMKGAPERIWDRCDTVLIDGKPEPKSEHETHFLDAQRVLMSGGERVLGCAYTVLPRDEYPDDFEYNTDDESINFPTEGLSFCGLVSLIDPPRVTVPDAVISCQTAGIKVIMVTGDHPDTAEAIAKQVNIIRGRTRRDLALEARVEISEISEDDERIQAVVVTGAQLAELDDAQLDDILDYDQIVFARTSPAQKLRIVKGLQDKTHIKRGYKAPGKPVQHIVAVTGDGVNDSPALKKANIGVAMGITGSDVAKEAADMILLDDNFASIVRGVEEGRIIFANLKKSIAYTLSSNIPEIAPFLIFILLRIPLPLPTVLILCIDLGTDMLPAISLAYEKKEADIMKHPPRDANKDRLVTNKLISFSYLQIGVFQAVAGFFTYMVVMRDYGFGPGTLIGNGIRFDEKTLQGSGFNTQRTLVHDTEDDPQDDAVINVSDCRFGSEGGDDPCLNPKMALRHAQSAYFVSIVIVQWADLIICKTRSLSIKQQGMSNNIMNIGLFTETLMCILFLYVPILHALGTESIRFVHWLPALPFMLLIVVYDETRKFFLRNTGKDGWVHRMTYY